MTLGSDRKQLIKDLEEMIPGAAKAGTKPTKKVHPPHYWDGDTKGSAHQQDPKQGRSLRAKKAQQVGWYRYSICARLSKRQTRMLPTPRYWQNRC
jgi:hypothetical protein